MVSAPRVIHAFPVCAVKRHGFLSLSRSRVRKRAARITCPPVPRVVRERIETLVHRVLLLMLLLLLRYGKDNEAIHARSIQTLESKQWEAIRRGE